MTAKTLSEHESHPAALLLPNGCRIVHQEAVPEKVPFPADIPNISMRQLIPSQDKAFTGQLGVIQFTEHHRLPRHVHTSKDQDGHDRLIAERIFVSAGVGLVELNGDIYIIAPNTIVDIAAGVPHTWTGCPPGILLPDGTLSNGSFLMLYQYEGETAFYPTDQLRIFSTVEEYLCSRYEGDLESIRFPKLTRQEVANEGRLAWGLELKRISL